MKGLRHFFFYTTEHTTSSSVSKKPRLDQIPAANLDADDPLTDVCVFFSIFFPFIPYQSLKDLLLMQYLLGCLKISDIFSFYNFCTVVKVQSGSEDSGPCCDGILGKHKKSRKLKIPLTVWGITTGLVRIPQG